MRICIDVDGVICRLRGEGETYESVGPVAGAVEGMQSLRAAGHYIILATARHMKTCDANVGLVVRRQGLTLLQWLDRHAIPYDEIWFGKPHADVYLDDNAVRFESWAAIGVGGTALPPSREFATRRQR